MADKTELERLAQAVNALRPEWPAKSVLSFLASHHANRAYADLAVAAVAVAVDPKSMTPARLSENGPWWQLTRSTPATAVLGPSHARCRASGHEHQLAHNCAACRADDLAGEAAS